MRTRVLHLDYHSRGCIPESSIDIRVRDLGHFLLYKPFIRIHNDYNICELLALMVNYVHFLPNDSANLTHKAIVARNAISTCYPLPPIREKNLAELLQSILLRLILKG